MCRLAAAGEYARAQKIQDHLAEVMYKVFGGKNIEEITEWRNISLPENANFSEESSITVDIKPDRKYLFNVGSIGQPRNQDPRSSFAVYDTDGGKITRYCLPYDILSAQEKILNAGLPKRLAERLVTGH